MLRGYDQQFAGRLDEETGGATDFSDALLIDDAESEVRHVGHGELYQFSTEVLAH